MSDPAPAPPAPPPSQDLVAGERHVSEVAGRGRRFSRKAGLIALIGGAAVAVAMILLGAPETAPPPTPTPELSVRPIVRFEPPPPAPPPAPPVVPVLASAPPPLPPQPIALPTTTRAAAPPPPPRASRLLVFSAAGKDEPPAETVALAGGREDNLAMRLSPTPLKSVAASVLPHQPYLLTQGTLIPCVLQTAMDSTLPGLVVCVIPQDVRGKTGLTLLDRGTRVVGEFRGGVRQGQERLFVVWTRAETPEGVVIRLDSPATDPLGRSGLAGEVDRHFWQRFGGALLLSVVNGAIQAGVAQASKEGTTTINTGETQGVIAESLKGSVDIPPTVRINQGALVSLLVARDLDFASVYRVQPTGEAE